MEEKSTGLVPRRQSATALWSYLNPRTSIYGSHNVINLAEFSEPVEAGRRDFVGPLGDMYPNDTILRPQRHCAETWSAAMDVNESWPTQKAEDTGEFCEIRIDIGFRSCYRDHVLTTCVTRLDAWA